MIYGMMDGYHGDEPEMEALYREAKERYDEEHADDWKYEDLDVTFSDVCVRSN